MNQTPIICDTRAPGQIAATNPDLVQSIEDLVQSIEDCMAESAATLKGITLGDITIPEVLVGPAERWNNMEIQCPRYPCPFFGEVQE